MNQSTKRPLSTKSAFQTRHLEPPKRIQNNELEENKNKSQQEVIPDQDNSKHQCKDKVQGYSKLRLNNEVYAIGDYVLIRETRKSDMIGKLIKIYAEGEIEKHPMIEVKWYFKKDDLDASSITLSEKNSLGDNEVFDTITETKIYADLLNGKCKVWKLEEYEGKQGLGVNDYYTRACYDPYKVLI